MGRIAYHPHRRERQSVLGGERRRDVGFHVDGERTGRASQRPLVARRHHRAIDAGEVRHDHALGMIGEACGDTMRDDRRRGMAAISSGDAGRDDHVAGYERGTRPPAMPMLMTARQSGCTRARSSDRSRAGLPPAMMVVTPGPAAEPRLGRHSGHRQDRMAMLRRPRKRAGTSRGREPGRSAPSS